MGDDTGQSRDHDDFFVSVRPKRCLWLRIQGASLLLFENGAFGKVEYRAE